MSKLHPNSVRIPPHDIDAEKIVLGTMLLDQESIPIALTNINTGMFYEERHRVIYSAIERISQSGVTADPITVMDEIRKKGTSATFDTTYVAELTGVISAKSRLENYCRIISEKSCLRELIRLAANITDECYKQTDVVAITEMFGKNIFALAAGKTDSAKTVKDVLPKVFEHIEERRRQGGGLAGVSTGFIDVDRMTSGLVPADLIIVAARPAMGKTSYAMNLAENVAV